MPGMVSRSRRLIGLYLAGLVCSTTNGMCLPGMHTYRRMMQIAHQSANRTEWLPVETPSDDPTLMCYLDDDGIWWCMSAARMQMDNDDSY